MASIVIPTWNRREELRATLRGLEEIRSVDWEVLVVANGCTDGTEAMVSSEFPGVRLIGLPVNLGMPAINEGLVRARAPVLMVLDDDALPAAGTVERAVRRFHAEPDLHALACAVREEDRIVNAHWGPLTLRFIGCGAFFRTETLRAIGGYASEIPRAGNEKELVCRLIGAGHAVSYDSGCVVVHRRSLVNRSWREGAYEHARDTAYRIARYHSVWCVPPGLSGIALYHLRRGSAEAGLRARDAIVLLRGLRDGFAKGWSRREPLPLGRRLMAGRLWRRELAARGRLWRSLAVLLPPDFWW